jgi:hypothetical protein
MSSGEDRRHKKGVPPQELVGQGPLREGEPCGWAEVEGHGPLHRVSLLGDAVEAGVGVREEPATSPVPRHQCHVISAKSSVTRHQ